MFVGFTHARKVGARFFAFLSLIWLAACDPVGSTVSGPNTGPEVDVSQGIQVALLVPGGSGQDTDNFIAKNLENAARLAIADLNGPKINLRVYNTAGGNPQQAASAAGRAVDEGAQIIVGPLFGAAANAAGVAVANRNVNLLAFSNNPTIAGGNVFILGPTFESTATRLVNYTARQGISRYAILHGSDLQGAVGRDSINNAVTARGAQVATVQSYPLSQQGIVSSVPNIANAVRESGADAVILTAGVNADLPIIATALPEAGISPADVKYIGLTRWDAAPQALALPGLQEGLFAMPDTATNTNFESRYRQTYGAAPHPLAGLAYDGIAAVGALAATGQSNALTRRAITTRQGFQGTSGIFRFLANGQNERGLAVATVRNNQVVILEAAPKRFGRAGF